MRTVLILALLGATACLAVADKPLLMGEAVSEADLEVNTGRELQGADFLKISKTVTTAPTTQSKTTAPAAKSSSTPARTESGNKATAPAAKSSGSNAAGSAAAKPAAAPANAAAAPKPKRALLQAAVAKQSSTAAPAKKQGNNKPVVKVPANKPGPRNSNPVPGRHLLSGPQNTKNTVPKKKQPTANVRTNTVGNKPTPGATSTPGH